jgi:dinuclear metal center YbgI/SA1388 family protein
MLIKEITDYLEYLFPPYLQETYDNTGKQIFYSDDVVKSIMLSLDTSVSIINEAIEKECNLIISHHPLIFRSLKNITASESRSDLIIKLIENRISLFAVHTNLDKVFYDKLGRVLGFENMELLNETNTVKPENTPVGFGIKTILEDPSTLRHVILNIKERLNLDYVVYSGDLDMEISRIAVMNGAGGGMIESVIQNNSVDCIITGDIGYHHAKYASDSSVAVIDAGHFGTEFILMTFLQEQLQDYLTKKEKKPEVNIHITTKEKNPLQVFTDHE